jgi:hypothetical protein
LYCARNSVDHRTACQLSTAIRAFRVISNATKHNEDGNPHIVTINPDTGVITPYTFPSPTPHGGGYDDVIFVGGKAFIAASNPTLNSSGVNTAPAIDEITLTNGQAVLTPILNGNATATDLVTN